MIHNLQPLRFHLRPYGPNNWTGLTVPYRFTAPCNPGEGLGFTAEKWIQQHTRQVFLGLQSPHNYPPPCMVGFGCILVPSRHPTNVISHRVCCTRVRVGAACIALSDSWVSRLGICPGPRSCSSYLHACTLSELEVHTLEALG